jgi:prophage tail gpP-like protein
MAQDRGWLQDEIIVSLTGTDMSYRLKDYSVKCSVFQQPAAFMVRLGEQVSATGLLGLHKPGDPFELRMQRLAPGSVSDFDLDIPMQTGRLDAVDVLDALETTIEFRGRDNMAALFDSYFMQEDSFTEATFYDLTAKQLAAVGFSASEWLLTGATGRTKAITNAGGGMVRKGSAPERTGSTTVEHLDYAWAWTPNAGGGAAMQKTRISAPSDPAGSDTDAKTVMVEDVTGGQPKTELKTIKANVGQQRYAWLKEQYKRVGLFLWCIPNGQFALSIPNTTQEPAFRLQRLRDGTPGENNILSGGLRNDTVQRYSHTLVFGRAGGGKDGRKRIVGEYIDNDLVEAGLLKQISFEENDVKTKKAADHLARRYAADARRASRSLTYVVAGHSAPSLKQPGKRFPFYVNTMVHVTDQKYGIDRDFYLGEVEFRRQPETTSVLTLYFPEDLVFAEEA